MRLFFFVGVCVSSLTVCSDHSGNDNMEAPRRGNGADFNPSAAYRMYHGERIPGFPSHPHRGFETVTATTDGLIDHADSVGNAGRYGEGDVQWMTAGSGVVHSEMFPLIKPDVDNPLRLFQIWLNLPAKAKMVKPGFAMFWKDQVPKYHSEDGKTTVTLWAGEGYLDVTKNNAPPADSWATDPTNDVAIFLIQMEPGAKFALPMAKIGKDANRSLYYVEGDGNAMTINGDPIKEKVILTVDASMDLQLELDASATQKSEILLLQGRPIGEPVAQHGPFVMNTQAEIQQAFSDYRRTQFGGWPWPRDDMVFEKDKPRFAKLYGKEVMPGDDGTCVAEN